MELAEEGLLLDLRVEWLVIYGGLRTSNMDIHIHNHNHIHIHLYNHDHITITSTEDK